MALPLAVYGLTAVLPASLAHAADSLTPAATSWVANSEHGGNPNDGAARWVQQDVEGAAVDSDGTMYAATFWDEGGSNVGVYKDGKVVGRLLDTGGWGRLGGSAVAVDAGYVYQAMQQNPQAGIDSPTAGTWFGFRRFDKSTRQQAGLPANGHSSSGSMRVVGTSFPVTGLASNGAEVYAAVAGEGRVHVYRTSDYSEVRSFAVPAVSQIALNSAGGVWVISGVEVREYSTAGALRRSITGVVKPTAVALDPRGRLLISTDGPRQQVLVYDVSATPIEVDAVGSNGGMFTAPRGAAGPLRFNGPVGVGADSAGNLYVANGLGGDGTDLRKLASTTSGWQEQWQLLGLGFVDNADLSPVDDTVAYTSRDRFQLDLSQPAGHQWVWKAHTVDRMAYPDDGRNKDTHQYVTPDAVLVGGKTMLFQTGMYQDSPRFYRFDGEVAVPSTMMTTGFHGWGWQVDARGDVWNTDGTVLRHSTFLDLSAAGDPQYSAPEVMAAPSGFQSLQRVHYDRRTDTMYLSGWTGDHPRPTGNDMEKMIGGEVWRINAWSTGNRAPVWRTVIPFSRVGTDIRTLYGQIGLSVVGDRFFTVESATSKVRSYSTSTGALLSEWLPGAEVGSYVGVVDVPDGIKAAQRADGTYVVFAEEDHAAKVLMYTLPGAVTPDASLSVATSVAIAPSAAPIPTTSVLPPSPSPSASTTSTSATQLTAYSSAVQADKPIARYSFEDGTVEGLPSGAIRVDGAMSGSKAWLVNGSSQVIGGQPTVDTGSSWSLESWVKVDPASQAGAPIWTTPGANWWGLVRTYNVGTSGQSGPLLSAYGAPTAIGTGAQEQVASATTGTWQHVVVTASPTTTRLYVNGFYVSERPSAGVSLPGWLLGSPNGSGFLGSLDEVAVYNTALTQDQVSRHYQAGTTAVSPPTPIVTVSPSPTPTVTVSPSPTPTVTVSPSPTPTGKGRPTKPPHGATTSSGNPALTAYSAAVRADRPITRYTFEDRAREGLPGRAVRTAGAMAGSKAWLVTGRGQVLRSGRPVRTGSAWSLEGWVRVDRSSASGAQFWATPGARRWGLVRTYRVGSSGQNTRLLSAYGAPTKPGGSAHQQFAEGVTGSWNYVVLTATARVTRLYVNGALISSQPNIGVSLPGWLLGSPNGSGFVGALDEVAVYAKALTPAQVSSHYRASRAT